MYAIGLMSGTSLDGVDACLVKINQNEEFEIVNFITLEYSDDFRKKIMRNLNKESARLDEISSLNFELGYYFKDAIDKVLEGTLLDYKDIEFVASHGQTIWHDPKGVTPSTLQIGEASVISYLTNIKTISNFRVMDVAAGGEGAPLVPFSEYMLYVSEKEDLVLLNIGGISNFTYLPKKAIANEVIAFDCGPGNIMIDYFTKKYFNKNYDKFGEIASSGKIIDPLLLALKSDEFILSTPPKSTGREKYSAPFMEGLIKKYSLEKYAPNDVVKTITEVTIFGIVYNLKKFIPKFDKLIVSGGGSHNSYIMKRLKEELEIEVLKSDISDSKEALAFVVLGYQTINNKPSNLMTVTNAKEQVILGNITPSPRRKEDFDGSRFKKNRN